MDPLRGPQARTPLLALLALLALAGCTGGISGIRLPGGPNRGSMTYDEAMGARSGLTTLDKVPTEEPARR